MWQIEFWDSRRLCLVLIKHKEQQVKARHLIIVLIRIMMWYIMLEVHFFLCNATCYSLQFVFGSVQCCLGLGEF
jgi:hypothetical protein